ncbi:MAG: glycosyltransferase [Rhizobacter sp.]
MRVLFVAVPGQGHVQPLLGLALAARARGHAVAWATGAEAFPLLRGCGLDTFKTGRPFGECIAQFRRENPEIGVLPGRMQAQRAYPILFGRIIAESMIAPLADVVARWRPGLIVSEPAALAAPLVARRHGVPQVTHEYGMPIPSVLLNAAADVMAPAWRAAGMAVPPDAGVYADAAIEIVPPSMRSASAPAPVAPRVLAQRPASVTGVPGVPPPASFAAFLRSVERRPLLGVTFGTLNAGGPAWQALLLALREIDVPCVVTSGPLVDVPADAPPHWYVARYLPHEHVLAHCRAVVSHAGAGVSLAAASLGLPQLCLPLGADQFRNADALAACGVARVLEHRLAPRALSAAIEQVLRDALQQAAARRLQAEIAARPVVEETVERLEALVVSAPGAIPG